MTDRMRFGVNTNLAKFVAFLLAWVLAFGSPLRCAAYAVLSHEAIIDSSWDPTIRPMLLKRFPHTTPEELKKAHAYAYGGAIIQDMGYYPHGNKFVSDLTHYVRTGDFVLALLRDASDVNGYAFALGALSHYAADKDGHAIGVNRAVPLLYPKVKKKYGDWVTYEEDPLAHVKTEFGFDVLEVAQGRYAPPGQPSEQRVYDDLYRLFSSLYFTFGEKTEMGQVLPALIRIAESRSLAR